MIDYKDIEKYRIVSKRLGLWDKDYNSIKKDLVDVIADMRNRDYSLDVLGSTFVQIVLMSRLIVYGNSKSGLSDEDLEALLSPFEETFESLDFAPSLLSNGIESAVNDLFPVVFATMEESESYDEFDRRMRSIMALPSKISVMALSYGIATGMCLRKYEGMEGQIEYLIKKLKEILKDSDVAKDIIKASDKEFKDVPFLSGFKDSFVFSAMFSAAVVECNLRRNVTYEQMYDFMRELDKITSKNKDFEEFRKSRDFRFFMHCIEEYHEINK